MAKPKNVTATEQITISTTPKVVKILRMLAAQGLHGKNVADVAATLIRERLLDVYVEQKRFTMEELGAADGEQA